MSYRQSMNLKPMNLKPHATGVLALIAIVFLAGCAAMGTGGVNLISIEEEWEMGQEFEAQLAEELEVSQSASLTSMGERIVAETELAHLPWRFYVVEDDSVNAFNVPGGLVYVNSGLINRVDSEQVAAVVAHEIGHGVARHGTQRLTQQYGLAMLAGAVLGEEPGVIQQIVAQIAAAGTIARFSRSQEHEADELGVRFMHQANYDPAAMIRMLEYLRELQQREPGAVEQFFATHPAIDDRIRRVQELVDAL
jgi:beta-barrel assembly-enhancing protease